MTTDFAETNFHVLSCLDKGPERLVVLIKSNQTHNCHPLQTTRKGTAVQSKFSPYLVPSADPKVFTVDTVRSVVIFDVYLKYFKFQIAIKLSIGHPTLRKLVTT